jgi:S-DNA-T family DNA segregation ATPase FtsK/SpoIIIE
VGTAKKGRKAAPRKGSSRKPTRKPARGRKRASWLETRQGRDVIGLLSIALGFYFGGIFLLGWEGGALGRNIEHIALLTIGTAAFVVPALLLVIGSLLALRSDLIDPGPFRAGIYVLIPTVLLSFGADRFGLGTGVERPAGFSPGDVVHHGGYMGEALYYLGYQIFGTVGTTIICVLGLIISVLLLTGSSVQAITSWWARRIGNVAVSAGNTSRDLATRIGEMSTEQLATTRKILAAAAEREGLDPRTAFPDIFGDVPAQFAPALEGAETEALAAMPGLVQPGEQVTAPTPRSRRKKHSSDQDDQLALLAPLEAEEGEPVEAVTDDELRARVKSTYKLPDATLLSRSSGAPTSSKEDVDRIKKLLVETFGHFGIEARIVGMVPGPRVSRYELALAAGTRMSKVENMRKDLAYALATTEIRILAPIPGKSAVGIEVENSRPGTVSLGDIWGGRPKKSSPLFVAFGKDITGDTIGADLAAMPHLLVAGTTGAGKSGCMNAILSSILLGATPDEVRMLLIDPKKVELSSYESVPHLLTPVVTNMKKASNALGNVISQMEERYAAMEIAGVRTLPDFNRLLLSRGQQPLPYILIVIDELADLVMTSKSDVEDAVIRLAQKGRAAGFHMVLATQRPSVDVITGMIKSNVPSRIAFAVSSQTDSRVIIDQNGAETLLGSGDMLFKPVWARSPLRVQGAWIGEGEVRSLADAARSQREPTYDADLLSEPESQLPEDDPGAVNEDDRLPEAIRLVAEFQTCSASFFQRRMRVGYTRGARLVDMLERRGIVSPGEGPRPRTVLITADDVPRLLEEHGTELSGAPME